MEPQIEYQITARVNGIEVYRHTTPLAETVVAGLFDARQAVTEEVDNLLEELTVGNKQYE